MGTDYKELIKREYLKCAVDPVYFIKKYCIIQHPVKGKIPFSLYPFQEETIKDFVQHRFSVILKARQLGLSTLTAAYSLWLMTFHTDKNILVIATKQSKAKNLVTKVRIMHANLPKWIQSTCIEDNKLSLKYKNGSQIVAETSAEDAARSEALSLLILDEAAFIQKVRDIWTASQQTLVTGGSCIALSTPNGVGNWFHETWVGAEEKKNMFHPIYLHWTVHPDRDQEWRDEQDIILGDKKKAAQECDCDFITSGDSVVSGTILKEYQKKFVRDPVEKRGVDSNLWIWKHVKPDKTYVVSADVARGDGSDFSTIEVWDVDEVEQCAEYQGKVDTKTFGDICYNIATEYNDALLIVENNNIGWAAIQRIIDRDYKNLFYSTKDLKYIDVKQQLTNKFYQEERKMIAGFSMTSKTRPLVIAKLEEYFRERTVKVYSARLINELFVFIYHAFKAQAMEGYNDDLTMATAIGLWVRDTAIRLRTEGVIVQKSILNNMLHQGVYTPNENRNDSWDWDIGTGEKDDLNWLL